MKANIGMIGMGVMGENLSMNMESKGYSVACYDIINETITKFINGRGKGHRFIGCYSLKELCDNLELPRKIQIMIKAGSPVDETIEKLIPLLTPGDIIIDGGNSNYEDTIRRCKFLESKGFRFIGMGVSGGEEGALNGPSLMPGGSIESWKYVKDIYVDISAKLDNGESCCKFMGPDGAGHYVKMVHNGIEYGDMQLICETYDLMKKVLKLSPDEMYEVFNKWNKGPLNSYLIEITSNILKFKDVDGLPIIDKILDRAGQKGTGKWASIEALNEAVPVTLITEAVYARCLSAIKDERINASKVLKAPEIKFGEEKEEFINALEKALYAAKIISYAQGFSLLRSASKTHNWNLNYGEISLTWRGGCIIRSQFLEKINKAYKKNKDLENLMLDDYFKNILNEAQNEFRKVVAIAAINGIPIPAMMSALSYFDGYRSENLPQNLLQAQRDYFGAHTYERVDDERGKFHHTNWTGHGGTTTASTYNA